MSGVFNLKRKLNVKYVLVVFCIFLVSCNKAVYFFDMEENESDSKSLPRITDRNSMKLFQRKDISLNRPKREKIIYQQPEEKELVVLDGKTELIQLAGADIPTLHLPEPETALSLTKDNPPSSPQPLPPPSPVSPQPLPPPLPVSPQPLPPPSPSPAPVSPPSSLPTQSVISGPVPHLEARDTTAFELVKNGQDLMNRIPEVKENPLPSFSTPSPVLEEVPPIVFIPRPLDILFVMDTSVSMIPHLRQFKEKFSGFLRYFSTLNWRFALTNADYGETGVFFLNYGALKGEIMPLEKAGKILNLYYLQKGMSDYDQIFLDSVSTHKTGEYRVTGNMGRPENLNVCHLPPFCQSLQEQPLKSLKSALVKNEDFFRKEADLAVVIISNSKERGGESDFSTEPKEVIEQFRSVHGVNKRFEVYGIIIIEDDTDCLNQNQAQQIFFPEGDFSDKIADLSTMTGGKVFSICSSHYQDVAQSIFDSFGKSQTE